MANIVDTQNALNDPSEFCWGYLEDNDTLYLGETHHALIISELINQGMTWDQLMATRQMWGWASLWPLEYEPGEEKPKLTLSFASDEAVQSKGIKAKVIAAMKQAFPGVPIIVPTGIGYGTSDNYGDRAKEQYLNQPKFPNGTKVENSSPYSDHQGEVGTVTKFDNDGYGNIRYLIEWANGTESYEYSHQLMAVDHTAKTASYSTPKLTTSNGVKVFDVRDYPSRSSVGDNYWSCCFGFINDQLFIGDRHHAKIIYELVDSGKESYESLMAAEQKWGWIRKDGDGDLIVSFTTDEAAQTNDSNVSKKCIDAIGEYFRKPAKIDPNVGEGHSNANNYGERSKTQYFGEPDESEAYCSDCDTYYDPEWESHDHETQYCDTCDTYYDANNYYEADEHDHIEVSHNIQNPQTQGWIWKAVQHARQLNEERAEYDPNWVDEDDIEVWLVSEHNFDQSSAAWVAEKAIEIIHATPAKPNWLPQGLHMVPTQKVVPTNMTPSNPPPTVGERYKEWHGQKVWQVSYYDPVKKVVYVQSNGGYGSDAPIPYPLSHFNALVSMNQWQKVALVRGGDLHDAEVFAKIALDYIKLGADEGGNITTLTNPDIEIGSQWKDDVGQIHTVTSIENGRVYYTFSGSIGGGHGSMSVDGWKYYMKPLSSTFQTPSIGEMLKTPADEGSEVMDPQAEGALKDDPALLAIERNPASIEWRWSMDDNELHIWRVLNRWQYGPSHYDMFGNEGYEHHSQGRVYVSPDGRVGVLYWQISHPNAEQTLNDWVEKKYGKQPDLVYRAYGGYKGYPTPRWYFPIVEVSGLPIGKSNRWWENGQKPNSWYYDNGTLPPNTKKKNYPAPKTKRIKTVTPQDAKADDFNPNKAQRRRRRNRNKQYRNRGRR